MPSNFDIQAWNKLPLAEGSTRLLDYALNDAILDHVFQRYSGRSYEKIIRFPIFVRLTADALLGHRGSAHQSFKNSVEADQLGVTIQAVYGKLARVPIRLSLGLFAAVAQRLRELATPNPVEPLPPSLKGFWTLGLDGKKIKYVAKKLKPLRGLRGNIFGGKLLVVQDLATKQAIVAEAADDGEAADNPLVAPAVKRVRELSDEPRLWVADRAFCEYKSLALYAEKDWFVVRYQSSCKFYKDESVPVGKGIDDENRPYREEWGWLGAGENRRRVRKITVERGEKQAFAIVTNLEDAQKYPAVDLLKLYRRRWGLEVMFQQVVQVFDLRHLIGSTPQAVVFQSMLCLLLYNTAMLVRDYVAESAGKKAAEVSSKLLFDDWVREMTAGVKVIGVDAILEILRDNPIATAEGLRSHLRKILANVWTDRWTKAPTRRGRKKPSQVYLRGGHSSVEKIMRGEHRTTTLKPEENQDSRE